MSQNQFYPYCSEMGRDFKRPAPQPPTPSASRFRTPMKATSRNNSNSNLSLVAAYDDLMRNSAVFHDGAEKQFLMFVKNAKDWRKKWHYAESERQRLSILLNEKEKEVAAKELKIKQAREMVNLEMRERARIEHDRDNLQRQWYALQELVNTDGGSKNIDNDTLQSIRSKFSPAITKHVQRTPSAKRHYYNQQENMGPLVEQSAESLVDASELSYDDSRDDILDGSRLRSGQIYKRRSSNVPQRYVRFLRRWSILYKIH